MFFILILALLIPLAAVVLDSQLGRALAALIERRGRGGDGQTERRVALLEGEVERLSLEVRRLEEQTEFMQRLLTDRASGSGSQGRGDSRE